MPTLISVHRLEYPLGPHYVACAAWGACYGVRFDLVVVLAVIANILVIVAANPLNALADIRSDAATSEKRHVAVAVRELGPRRLAVLTVLEMVTALAIATAVSWKAAAGMALIILLYLAYNVEPVRLKRRGYAGPVTMSLATWLLPSVIAYGAAGGEPDAAVWLVFVGVAALSTARGLWWAVPDRAGDQRTGVLTPAVRYGTQHALAVADHITAAGLVLLGAGLWMRYGIWWALAGVAAGALFLLARDLPTTKLMLRYGFTLAVCGTVVMAAIPLLASG